MDCKNCIIGPEPCKHCVKDNGPKMKCPECGLEMTFAGIDENEPINIYCCKCGCIHFDALNGYEG